MPLGNQKKTQSFYLCVCISFLLCFASFAQAKETQRRPHLFNDLKKKLIADGFDEKLMEQLFAQKEIDFESKIISSYFMHRESKLNYDQFKSPDTIARAKAYMKTHAKELANAEAIYGVDKTVIVAIILVETRLGKYVGNNSIFNILATMASLDKRTNRDILWRENQKTIDFSRKEFDKKARRKSEWAYNELVSFITYAQKEHVDPMGIKGSYAGAMGLPQFMPSNALVLGVDGNKDRSVDLFNHADAIASVANYLKRYGWKPGISRKQKYDAVYHYNHSSYYVNTILDISDILKG